MTRRSFLTRCLVALGLAPLLTRKTEAEAVKIDWQTEWQAETDHFYANRVWEDREPWWKETGPWPDGMGKTKNPFDKHTCRIG